MPKKGSHEGLEAKPDEVTTVANGEKRKIVKGAVRMCF